MYTVILVMGVSGSGKSTVGLSLAQHLSLDFLEGDDFHPPANKHKMAAGIPLNDSDRIPWLLDIKQALNNRLQQLPQHDVKDVEKERVVGGIVLSCSALKRAYRRLLFEGLEADLLLVYLDGSREELATRMERRMTQGQGHFMPVSLLQSQFEALEVPTEEEMETLAAAGASLAGSGQGQGKGGGRRMLCKVSFEVPLEEEIKRITSFVASRRIL